MPNEFASTTIRVRPSTRLALKRLALKENLTADQVVTAGILALKAVRKAQNGQKPPDTGSTPKTASDPISVAQATR